MSCRSLRKLDISPSLDVGMDVMPVVSRHTEVKRIRLQVGTAIRIFAFGLSSVVNPWVAPAGGGEGKYPAMNWYPPKE